MSTRSITPRTSCSEPIGISVATTCGPNDVFRESSVRKKSARSRSSMLTNTRRARSSSAARLHRRVEWISTPITALITNTADSHTRRAPSASAMKLESPGVSSRLTLRCCHSNELSASEIDICRAFSSGSASETVVPSVTLPSRFTTPAWNSSASCNDVLPAPRWPTRATLRMRSAALCMADSSRSPTGGRTLLLVSISACADRPRAHAPGGPRRMRRGLLGLVEFAGELGAQAQHGLGVQLRHPRLGHAEHLADLAEGEVLVVVERDDELLTLGQRGDGIRDPLTQLGLVDERLRVGRAGVGQRVEQRDLIAARIRDVPHLVQRDDRRVGDLDELLLEVLDRDLQLGRHLLVGRRALELGLELHVGPLELTGTGAHRAGHPVERPQLIDD